MKHKYRRGSERSFSSEADSGAAHASSVPMSVVADGVRQPSLKGQLCVWSNKLFAPLGLRLRLSPFEAVPFMTTREKRLNIYHLASQVIAYDVAGDFVELGTHAGGTAALLTRVISEAYSERRLHVYDSFAGLPAPASEDRGTWFQRGEMSASVDDLRQLFDELGIPRPEIHRGWFQDVLPQQLPEAIAFAHLDGDFYESIKWSLQAVWPRLSTGGIVLIDDYCDGSADVTCDPLPGVRQACDEFFDPLGLKVIGLFGGGGLHGFVRKPIDTALSGSKRQ